MPNILIHHSCQVVVASKAQSWRVSLLRTEDLGKQRRRRTVSDRLSVLAVHRHRQHTLAEHEPTHADIAECLLLGFSSIIDFEHVQLATIRKENKFPLQSPPPAPSPVGPFSFLFFRRKGGGGIKSTPPGRQRTSMGC